MRIGLVIAEFDSYFTTSFKHTARVKYNADFESSNINSILENIATLKHNIQTGNINPVHVGYDFTIDEVHHIEHLLQTIIKSYTDTFNTPPPPNKKIYSILQQIRDANSTTANQLAKDVLKEILTPPTAPQQTKKERIKEAAKAKSKERILGIINKKSAKKNDKG